jgi:hypothetical protein
VTLSLVAIIGGVTVAEGRAMVERGYVSNVPYTVQLPAVPTTMVKGEVLSFAALHTSSKNLVAGATAFVSIVQIG